MTRGDRWPGAPCLRPPSLPGGKADEGRVSSLLTAAPLPLQAPVRAHRLFENYMYFNHLPLTSLVNSWAYGFMFPLPSEIVL